MLLHCTWMGPPSCIRLRLRKTVLLLLLCYQPWWQRWRRQRARQQRRERRLRRWRIDWRLRRRLAARVATFRAASAQSSFHEEKVGEGMFALCTAASGRTCVPMVIPSVGTWVPSVRGVARRVSATRRSRESGGGGPALSSVGGDRDVEATWRAGEPVAGRPRHPHQPPPRPRPAAPPLRPRFFFFCSSATGGPCRRRALSLAAAPPPHAAAAPAIAAVAVFRRRGRTPGQPLHFGHPCAPSSVPLFLRVFFCSSATGGPLSPSRSLAGGGGGGGGNSGGNHRRQHGRGCDAPLPPHPRVYLSPATRVG